MDTCCSQWRRTLAMAGSGGGAAGVFCMAVTRVLVASLTPGGDDAKP
jgi:hypothetical protein